jgi:UDP-N-acetyl-D-galactosamine dehydrogenase
MTLSRKISVIGLGYVGLPVAVAFGQSGEVIGFDKNQRRIKSLKNHHDYTHEVSSEELKNSQIYYTDNFKDLKKADFHIVAVPTPIDEKNEPDLTLLRLASESVGAILKKGDIVVYESTVYPGTTEEECLPILEEKSGLKCGVDFSIGYSPERINPGDKEHTFTKIMKVVSGFDAATLDIIAQVYGSVVKAGIHKASSIKVAEAAKIIENTQRDINIGLMNELAMIFHKMDIDTSEVLAAANTKWNFLRFTPGLVGGHCIGVDPYYLTYKAQKLGVHPQIILAGRKTNDRMADYIANTFFTILDNHNIDVKTARIGFLGVTFKENCPDIRNSKAVDLAKAIRSRCPNTIVVDPFADEHEFKEEYGFSLSHQDQLNNCDAVIVAVCHQPFKEMSSLDFLTMMPKKVKFLFDIKHSYDKQALLEHNIHVWKL